MYPVKKDKAHLVVSCMLKPALSSRLAQSSNPEYQVSLCFLGVAWPTGTLSYVMYKSRWTIKLFTSVWCQGARGVGYSKSIPGLVRRVPQIGIDAQLCEIHYSCLPHLCDENAENIRGVFISFGALWTAATLELPIMCRSCSGLTSTNLAACGEVLSLFKKLFRQFEIYSKSFFLFCHHC